jgi:hypothetical protein
MGKWIQLPLPIDSEKDKLVLPMETREEVVKAVASLLLQVLSVDEEREAEDEPRS